MSNAIDLEAALSNFPLRGKVEPGGVHDIQLRWDEGGWEFDDSPGVYLFYGANGDIIYIGTVKHLGGRTGNHFRRTYQVNPVVETRDPWQTRPVSLQMIRTEEQGAAAYLEKYLIEKLGPQLNIRK